MTIRRSERDWYGYSYPVNLDDDNDDGIRSVLRRIAAGDDDLRRDVIRPVVSNVHPAITNYGPESLVHFLRSEIESAVLESLSSKANGKGKERASMETYYSDTGMDTATLIPSTFDPKSGPPQPNPQVHGGSLQLAPDALLYLKGLKSSKESSADVLPLSELSANGFESADEAHRQFSAGTRQFHSSAHEAKIPATSARLDDFAQYTQEARNRTRSAQAQSSDQPLASKSVGGPVYGPADMSSTNPFRAPEVTSEFSPPMSFRQLSEFDDTTFNGSDDRNLRSSSLSEYPTHQLSDLSQDSDTESPDVPISEDDKAGELLDRLQSLNTDSDRDDLSSHDIEATNDCDYYHKAISAPVGIKVFDYSCIVPTDQPRLVRVTEKAEGKRKATPFGKNSGVALLRHEALLRRRPDGFATPLILTD